MEIKMTLDELAKKKLFVATPMYGGACTGNYTKSMCDLTAICTRYNVELQFYALFNESLITRARNYAADEFLRSKMDYFLFIDADIGFNPQDVIAMLGMMTPESPYDVLCGPYPKKNISWEKIVQAVNKGVADTDPSVLDKYVGDYVFNPKSGGSFPINEPVEILEGGTGFMMMRRNTLEKFQEAFPQYMYRPDHVRTAHFDGSREICQFFQAEIDPKTKRYLSEDYWWCCDSQTRITTEDGVKTIKEIVDADYKGEVMSVDQGGNVVWSKVLSSISRANGKRGQPETKKKWVKLNTHRDNNTKAKPIITADHRVAYFTDILNPSLEGYAEAKDMAGKYCIRGVQKSENALYSPDQISFVVGTLMGDSYIHKSGQLLTTHSPAQEEYIRLKAKLFNGSINSATNQSNNSFGPGFPKLNLHTPVNEQLHHLRELFYVDGKKTVKNILPLLDDKALAFWYMDDGSLNKKNASLYTNGFTYDDHVLLKEWFEKTHGIIATIDDVHVQYKGETRNYNKIRFVNKESEKLFKIVAPYIIDELKYKLPEAYHDVVQFNYFSVKSLDFSASLVKEVKYLPRHSSRLFDIEVENTNNFFGNGTLVHNCQKIQEIDLKIWLCPWFQLTHMGSMIYGGSLADLAAVGASPTADQSKLGKKT